MTIRGREVAATDEFRRICALPRRDPEEVGDLVRQLTDLLKTPGGTMTLRPAQALALHDIGTLGGLVGPIRVGGGKTLVSLLAPYVLDAERPLLLLPAALIGKTNEERARLMKHWRIPRNIRIESYQALGRVDGARMIELYRPDLIIADEAHRLKNPRAACTRRVTRYMEEHPGTKFVVLSGTLIKHSLRDFGKMAAWALRDGAPVPRDWGELEEWADALDEKVNALNRMGPGCLGPTLAAARAWFQERLLWTPGVVSTPGEQVGCSLQIRALEYPVNQVTEQNFKKLRDEWATPDGWTYSMATDIWRHARELALGMHYVWDPRPPQEWLDARKAWAQFVRETIKDSMYSNHPLDSELQVVNAVDDGDVDDSGLLAEWRRIKPTFQINQKAVWHDESALEACADWMHKNKGIVWCEHTFFAHELTRRTGFEYFGAGGLDKHGQPIERCSGDAPIIASMSANGTGRNLQMFSKNLITSYPPGADICEQLLGRTHRDGQEADEVEVDVLLACAEHDDAFRKSMADARMHQDVMGQPQKLLIADVDWPPSKDGRGARWTKTSQ